MATWNLLPTEIRNLVLYFFCLNIVEEYRDLHIHLNDEEYNASAELKWPKPPECLSSLASALRTCHYFHNVIKQTIKIDGEFVVDILQGLQFHKLMETEKALHGFLEHHIGLYFSTVGYVWRNPLFLRSGFVVESLKLWDDPKFSLMLIPHLEHWVKQRCVSSPSNRRQQIRLTLSDMEGNAGLVLSTDLEGLFITVGHDALEICPVAEFREIQIDVNNPKAAHHHNFEHLPIVEDIIDSSTHSWWLFRRYSYQWDMNVVNKWWCLINYETKKMHMRPQYTSRVNFGNVWNPCGWKIFRIRHG
jgi:hypothetical protein